jgi:hypothetical protein
MSSAMVSDPNVAPVRQMGMNACMSNLQARVLVFRANQTGKVASKLLTLIRLWYMANPSTVI